MRDDETPEEDSPGRALLAALAAMLGVAVLVGLAVGGVVLGAVRLSGVGEEAAAGSSQPDRLVLPKYKPTRSAGDELDLPEVEVSQTPTPTPSATKKAPPITLLMAPAKVGPGARINLNGVYRQGEGVSLQIQRKENGAWIDFPVTATVSGGAYATWITTSRVGAQQFRMYDEAAGRASNVVTVTVG